MTVNKALVHIFCRRGVCILSSEIGNLQQVQSKDDGAHQHCQ